MGTNRAPRRILRPSFHREKTVKPITIIGGGLAGLALGIELRQRSAPVTIIEAGRYPRHRVCGEFISGGGIAALRRLGLEEMLSGAGPYIARTAAFFGPRRVLGRYTLPSPAICMSRFALDAALARKFCDLGGELRIGERWRENQLMEGVVRASGRRLQPTENGSRWFGLKAHARNVVLEADLEMHISRNSYVGLCRLPAGVVNICGLFRRRVDEARPAATLQSIERLRGEHGSLLSRRLAHAELDESSFCGVAGLSFRMRATDRTDCRIGDALTMIPPITGNGMSMAFESALLAVEPLIHYSRGEEVWVETSNEVARLLSKAFKRRLFWAGLVHRLMFSPFEFAGRLVLGAEPFWRSAFKATR